VLSGKIVNAGVIVGSIVECEVPNLIANLPECERISYLIGKRCAIVFAPERSKSKDDSVLDKVMIDELSVDPKERGIRL
jgi:hypothetical protein